jgi:hypothetical protein
MEWTFIAFSTIFRTNCCLLGLIVSVKGYIHADKESKNKNRSKIVSVLEKVMLGKLDREMSIAAVRCHYDVNLLVIHLITKYEIEIRKALRLVLP